MIALPGHRALHDLAVNASIALKVTLVSPVFEIEEIAEELERPLLVEQAQTHGAFKIPSKQRPLALFYPCVVVLLTCVFWLVLFR